MADTVEGEGVDYRTLVTDQALVSVFLVSSVASFGVAAVPVALPAVGDALRLSEADIGLVMGTFEVGVVLMLPVVSILLDVHGRRPVVIPSLLLFAASGLATLGVESFPVLLGLRVVQGAAFAGTLPLAATLIGDLYTGAQGSSAQGIRAGLNGLAGAVSPVVAGGLTVMAWQYPFALFALVLPVAAIVYRYYPEPLDDASVSDDGRPLLDRLGQYGRDVWDAADRTLGLLVTGGFALFFYKATFRTFLPVFAVSSVGISVTGAGTLLGLYGGTRAVVAPASGSVVAGIGRKRTMLAAMGLVTVGLAAVSFAPTFWVLGGVTVAYSTGEALLNPTLNDAVAAHANDEQRGAIVGGLLLAKQFALVVAPVLVGATIELAGFRWSFIATGVLGVGYSVVIAVWLSPE